MLETPSIRWYSPLMSHPFLRVESMRSDNPFGADNQQERLDAYIAGFVDGEGSFHVAVCRNAGTTLGWQLVPEVHVSQNAERREVLDLIQERFGCGRIRENHRAGADSTLVLVIRKRGRPADEGRSFLRTTAPSELEASGLLDIRPHREGDGSRGAPERRRLRCTTNRPHSP